MTALNATTVSKVLEELRAQKWDLTPSPNGDRWRAEPPDAKRKVVHFAARPGDLTLVLRDLRDQGFRWPPAGSATEPPAVVRSVPFAPKPHPDAGDALAAPPRGALALVRPPQGLTVDQAFAQLKEARELVLLAGAELGEADQVLEAAIAAQRTARAAYDELVEDLGRRRAVFDALFGAPEGAR